MKTKVNGKLHVFLRAMQTFQHPCTSEIILMLCEGETKQLRDHFLSMFEV